MIDLALFNRHTAVLGITGSGKSYTTKGIVERLLDAGRRVCVIDPTGVWWGLRSSADGKRAGYGVAIFGGEHADVPIAETSGAAVAGLIGTKNLPSIIDLSEMLIGARQRFVTDFAEALHRVNRAPLHLVIDEADESAPQNPMPEQRRMLHQIDRIVRRGRVRGFRVVMVTQRPAVLHKNVLTQANVLIAMRLTAPQDRKPVEEWIKGQADLEQGREVLSTLAKLKRGEGWVWAPEADTLRRETFPRSRTFDSMRTPEDGEVVDEPTKLAEVDLAEIRSTLAGAEAEARANDPAALRKRIGELERQLAARAKALPTALAVPAPPAKPVVERVEVEVQVPVFREGEIAQLSTAVEKALEAAKYLGTIGEQLAGAAQTISTALRASGALAVSTHRPSPKVTSTQPARSAPPRPEAARAPSRVPLTPSAKRRTTPSLADNNKPQATGARLAKAERAILMRLAQYPQGRTKRQVAILTGYAVNGGGFNNAVSSLATRGYIHRNGDTLSITDDGLEGLGEWTPLPNGPALLAHWLGQLGKAERSVLETVAEAWPDALSKADVAAQAGYAADGGGFNNAVSRLRTLELVSGRNELKASDELFEE